MVDGYLLVPDGAGPFPGGAGAVLRAADQHRPRDQHGQGTHDYGLQLVRRGFVTLSIGTPGSVEKIGLETRQLLTEAGANSGGSR